MGTWASRVSLGFKGLGLGLPNVGTTYRQCGLNVGNIYRHGAPKSGLQLKTLHAR